MGAIQDITVKLDSIARSHNPQFDGKLGCYFINCNTPEEAKKAALSVIDDKAIVKQQKNAHQKYTEDTSNIKNICLRDF